MSAMLSLRATPKRTLRLTAGIVKSTLVRHKRTLGLLVAVSLLLGIIPTVRSELTDERMRHTLAAVGIVGLAGYSDILDAPAKSLSGGQEQRLAIARMMLDESEVVILDEPLSGVDVFTFRDILPQLSQTLREKKHTVLLISHRLAFISAADHVIVLSERGEILEEGSPKDLLVRGGVFLSLHAAASQELRL